MYSVTFQKWKKKPHPKTKPRPRGIRLPTHKASELQKLQVHVILLSSSLRSRIKYRLTPKTREKRCLPPPTLNLSLPLSISPSHDTESPITVIKAHLGTCTVYLGGFFWDHQNNISHYTSSGFPPPLKSQVIKLSFLWPKQRRSPKEPPGPPPCGGLRPTAHPERPEAPPARRRRGWGSTRAQPQGRPATYLTAPGRAPSRTPASPGERPCHRRSTFSPA